MIYIHARVLFSASCQPGQFYNLTLANCTGCEIGFYQPMAEQFYCLPCPAQTTTKDTGTVALSQCYREYLHNYTTYYPI